MTDDRTASIVLGFPSYREPSQRLAETADIDYAEVAVRQFPDGESLVRLPERLPPHVVFCCSLNDPNSKLVELELAAATAFELGARRLTLVAPYLCYMRQDTAFHPGEAVSQRVVGELLARRFDALITVDPHLHRTADLGQAVPVRRAVTLSAASAMAERLSSRGDNPFLMGPDGESAQWVSAIATPAGLDFGVAEKTRLGDCDVRIELPQMPVAGRHVVLVDDVASTGQTLIETARALGKRDVASISVLVTHALFVGDALSRLKAAGVSDVCSTDSVVHATNGITLAGILAEALTRL